MVLPVVKLEDPGPEDCPLVPTPWLGVDGLLGADPGRGGPWLF